MFDDFQQFANIYCLNYGGRGVSNRTVTYSCVHIALKSSGSPALYSIILCNLSSLGRTKWRELVILCSPAVALRTFRWRHVQPQSTFRTKGARVQTSFGSAVAPWYLYDLLGRTSNQVRAPLRA